MSPRPLADHLQWDEADALDWNAADELEFAALYEQDWAAFDNVLTGTYTDAAGNVASEVKMRRGNLTRNDVSGNSLGTSPRDVVYTVWPLTCYTSDSPALLLDLEPGGVIHVQTRDYTIIQIISERSDQTQTRVMVRRNRG